MVIRLKTRTSESFSQSAAVIHEDGNGYRLRFTYTNTPKPDEQELRPHIGHCELLFGPDLNYGEGEYFTNHQRLTHGTMKLTRKGA